MSAKDTNMKSLRREIEKRLKAIAEERDKLRKLIGDADDLLASEDDCVELLENAVDSLSQYA